MRYLETYFREIIFSIKICYFHTIINLCVEIVLHLFCMGSYEYFFTFIFGAEITNLFVKILLYLFNHKSISNYEYFFTFIFHLKYR